MITTMDMTMTMRGRRIHILTGSMMWRMSLDLALVFVPPAAWLYDWAPGRWG